VILVDTSAWVEFLRDTGSPQHLKLRSLIESGADVATTEVVIMEILAGIGDPLSVQSLRSHLLAFPLLRIDGLADYEEAAGLYRECRSMGHTIPSLVDCVIAAVAIREGARVLHNDADFDTLAELTSLQVESSR